MKYLKIKILAKFFAVRTFLNILVAAIKFYRYSVERLFFLSFKRVLNMKPVTLNKKKKNCFIFLAENFALPPNSCLKIFCKNKYYRLNTYLLFNKINI